MRNSPDCFGVYSNMHRLPLLLVCLSTALAQQPPAQDPLDAAIQAVYAADGSHFQDAAAVREQARTLLQHVPAGAPRFAAWTQQVAQLFGNAGRNAEARAILEEGLTRTAPLGASHPSRISLLNELSASWENDGNLLKAVGYLEQSAAAQAAAPPRAPGQFAVFNSGLHYRRIVDSPTQGYIRLAVLYRKLGRPEAAAALAVKIRALATTDKSAVAEYYQQLGQPEEAAAVYREMAEQATDPQSKANAWQNVANIAASQQHFTDAIAAMEEAIAAVQSSGVPGIAGQSFWMRQNLAGYMHSAGLTNQAGQIYQQLLEESQSGPQENQSTVAYAQYLADSGRAAQGENLLKGYLADHPNLDSPWQINILYTLANFARKTGDSKSADRYQQAAQALQPPPAAQPRVAGMLQDANTALAQNRLPDAYRLASDAIDSVENGADVQSIVSMAPSIASILGSHKEPAKADQLYRRLLAVAEIWKTNSMQPLTSATRSYVDFLRNQPERVGELPAAIEQYRRVLVEANGPDSASLAEPLRMKIESARVSSQWPQAEAAARELLELQESLSGNTSEPYLSDLQLAARTYQIPGDYGNALPLYRKAIAIADLVATLNNDWHRAETRMDTAFALAQLGQFDEALTLGEEAVAMRAAMRVPRLPMEQQLQQIRRMKAIAARTAGGQ